MPQPRPYKKWFCKKIKIFQAIVLSDQGFFYLVCNLSSIRPLDQYFPFTKWVFTLLTGALFFGCTTQKSLSPSFLIIAIDRLSTGSVSCPEYTEKGEGGFYRLCNDFVRFQNMYTTSLQSSSALGSLLTGQIPWIHDLRHAENVLSFKSPHLAYSLFSQGYETGFFYMGDPIASYQGLERGFKTTYNLSVSKKKSSIAYMFEKVSQFFNYNAPKFVLVHIPILRLENQRPKALSEIENGLEKLFKDLEKKKQWFNTLIAVVGLQGELKNSYHHLWPIIQLSEENIKVGAFVKLPSKPRNKEKKFLIDENLSLADLGQTFFDISLKSLNESSKNQKLQTPNKLRKKERTNKDLINTHFNSKSIFQSLQGTSKKRETHRKILVESAWPDWRYGLNPIYLIIKNQYRAYLNEDIQIFNTLLNKEVARIKEGQASEHRWLPFIQMNSILKSKGVGQFQRGELEELNYGYKIWGAHEYEYPQILKELDQLIQKFKNRKEIYGWQAQLAVQHSDCRSLLKIAKKANNLKWSLAAKLCLGQKIKFNNNYRKACLRVFFEKIKTWSNKCQNELLYQAWKFIRFDQSDSSRKNLRSLLKQHKERELKMSINWATYLSSSHVRNFIIEPSDYDLYYLQLSAKEKESLDKL